MKLLHRFAADSWKDGRFVGVQEFQLHGIALILLVAFLGWRLGCPFGVLAWIGTVSIALVLVWPEIQRDEGFFWSKSSSGKENGSQGTGKREVRGDLTSSHPENVDFGSNAANDQRNADLADDEYSGTRSRGPRKAQPYNARLGDLYIDLSTNPYKHLLESERPFDFTPEPEIGQAQHLEELTFALMTKAAAPTRVKKQKKDQHQATRSPLLVPYSRSKRQTTGEGFASLHMSQRELPEEIAQDILCQTGIMTLEGLAAAYRLDPREVKLLNEG